MAQSEQRRTQSSESWQERTNSSAKSARVHGARLHELMRAAHDIGTQYVPGIAYAPRADARPEVELSTLAAVYRYVLDCHAKNEAVSDNRPHAGKEIDE